MTGFSFKMVLTIENIIVRLKESVDSDDVFRLGAEIELQFKPNEIELIKKALQNISNDTTNNSFDQLYLKYLLNFLCTHDEFH